MDTCNILIIDMECLFHQVKMALQYMRRVIQKKAKFDIMDLNAVQVWLSVLFEHPSIINFSYNIHVFATFTAVQTKEYKDNIYSFLA